MTRPTGRGWLLAPVVVLCAADMGLTLAGQPSDYWAGHFDTAQEGNPLARPLLVAGPAVFMAAGVVWLTVVSAVVLFWRHWAGAWAAVVLAVGHAVAGAGWVALPGGWWVLAGCGYLVATAAFTRWCWQRAGVTSSASPPHPS